MQPELDKTGIHPNQKPMYKRIFISSILLIFGLLAYSQETQQNRYEQEENLIVDTLTADSVVIKGVHPWKEDGPVEPKEAFWSAYLHGGFNVFDGDFTSEKKHGVYAPSVGLGGMYHFNNTWGIGADYIFRMYRVTGRRNSSTAPIMLKGMAHQADAFITFDIFNAWRPQNRFKLFALNLMLGGGVTWFKNSIYYPNEYHTESDGVTITLPQRWNYKTAQQKSMSNDKYTCRSLFLAGATFEFNVTRGLAVGFRGVYNYYTKDDIDGRPRGNNNDGVFDATIILRYKINAVKRSHMANFRSEQVLARKIYDLNPNHGRDLDDMPTNTYFGEAAGRDTVVMIHRDTIVAVSGGGYVQKQQIKTEKLYYIYFDPNEYVLYDNALQTIQQVADLMNLNNNLCLEITGYCDNTGSDDYNMTLGSKRAHSVAEEFMMEYGIESSRIKEIGMGIIRGRRSTASYSPNRRVVIRVLTSDEFEQAHGQRPVANQQVPSPKNIVVKRGETLSKLARRYYGNTHCWIYIFEANLDVMPTPNSIHPGMELQIPSLTEKQMLITKEEAKERYENYKL